MPLIVHFVSDPTRVTLMRDGEEVQVVAVAEGDAEGCIKKIAEFANLAVLFLGPVRMAVVATKGEGDDPPIVIEDDGQMRLRPKTEDDYPDDDELDSDGELD